jgi:hypothetical protein
MTRYQTPSKSLGFERTIVKKVPENCVVENDKDVKLSTTCQSRWHRLFDHFVGFPLLAVPVKANTNGLNFASLRQTSFHPLKAYWRSELAQPRAKQANVEK